MKAYLDILRKVVTQGETKQTRAGETLVIPPQTITHDLREGFPLLTTKRIAWKAMLTELEGFIGGITDKRWYQERKCKIWNEWSSPLGEGHDLGPIYGLQWRRFDSYYDGPLRHKQEETLYVGDQLANIVRTLKTNPDDRRMVCSAWNPSQNDLMALPPCHIGFIVQHINGVLHLQWTQRSCDMFLGVPFNLASYSMLLTLLAKESGMTAGTVTGTLVDCHVYTDHLAQCNKQLTRDPRPLPEVYLNRWEGFWNWKATDTYFENYVPQGKIKAEVNV